MDKTTFEYGELRVGSAAACAYANMAHKFISSFSYSKYANHSNTDAITAPATTEAAEPPAPPTSTPSAPSLPKKQHEVLYNTLIRTIFSSLLQAKREEKKSINTVPILESCFLYLVEQQKTILEDERRRSHPRRKKWEAPTKIVNLDESSSESDEDEDKLEKKREEREKRLKEEEAAWEESCRLEEMREIEREKNEAELRARERVVGDAAAFQELLESDKTIVLHRPEDQWSHAAGGKGNNKNIKKGGHHNVAVAMSREEWGAVLEDQARLKKEKEFLEEVLSQLGASRKSALVGGGGEEEVEAAAAAAAAEEEEKVHQFIQEWKEEVAGLEREAVEKQVPQAPRPAAKVPTKGQITEGNGKIQKLTQDRNRVMVMVKAMEGVAAENVSAVIELAQKKAEVVVRLQRV